MARPAAAAAPVSAGKTRLRLWIRLLRTTRAIEAELRNRLRREFNATLPRFDVLAALYRRPDGMMMGELSRFLMVSNGNVTPIVETLVNSGLVLRSPRAGDRRSLVVSLTAKGTAYFEAMAAARQAWVDELLGGLSMDDAEHLAGLLGEVNPQQVLS